MADLHARKIHLDLSELLTGLFSPDEINPVQNEMCYLDVADKNCSQSLTLIAIPEQDTLKAVTLGMAMAIPKVTAFSFSVHCWPSTRE